MYARAGFRAASRQPAVVLGEIVWRWVFGAAAWVLVILALRRILARVDVSNAEVSIARHSDWFQIADACAHIIAQVLPQLGRACAVLVPTIAVLWIATATVGRALTLDGLFAQLGLTARKLRFGGLLVLHVVRALFTLATLVAFFGALFLAGTTLALQNPAAAFALWICLAALVFFFWSAVNWFLALAPIWIVRHGRPTLSSFADSVNLYRRSPGHYAAIALRFAIFRAIALVAAFIVALIATQAPPEAAIALSVLVAFAYFAVADFLYIARLAAFVALDDSCQPTALESQPIGPTLGSDT